MQNLGLAVLAIGVLASMTVNVRAQATTAALHGIIRDQTGGVLPGASVTATHLESGRERMVQTDASGRYLLTPMPVGVYELKVELSGFRQEVRRGARSFSSAANSLTASIGRTLPIPRRLWCWTQPDGSPAPAASHRP